MWELQIDATSKGWCSLSLLLFACILLFCYAHSLSPTEWQVYVKVGTPGNSISCWLKHWPI